MYRKDDPTVWFAYNSTPFTFLNSLKHNHQILGNPLKIYKLAINNAVLNHDLTPLKRVRGYCYKIPLKSIKYARKFNFPEMHRYLESNKWLTSLGGF